jgi:large subunit ribosomal protein L22
MEARATARQVRGSARKIRQVAAMIRGLPVQEALNILQFVPKACARPLEKTVRSATANAMNVDDEHTLDIEDLKIKTVYVDGGPVMKRIHYGPRGSASTIRKRTSHITVVVAG